MKPDLFEEIHCPICGKVIGKALTNSFSRNEWVCIDCTEKYEYEIENSDNMREFIKKILSKDRKSIKWELR